MLAPWWIGDAQAGGTVSVPIDEWQAIAPTPSGPPSPEAAWPIARSLTGALDRGLFTGTLRLQVDVRATAPVAVPVVGGDATIARATLDGRPVSVYADPTGGGPGAWTVDAPPGVHELVVDLLHGRRTERFGRNLGLALPPAGPTAITIGVPESPIDATLGGGVLVGATPTDDGGTRITGWLDGAGRLELGWERRADQPLDPGAARVDATVSAVVSIGEDVVTGIARYALAIREGEIDRFAVGLPPEVEVVDVAGPGVLQWHTDATGELVVLLRHIADASAEATVRYQYPVRDAAAEVPIRVPVPSGDGAVSGAVGVDAPVALELAPGALAVGRWLAPRDVPQAVLGLTDDPLRTAIAFDAAPEGGVQVTRRSTVEVSTTRIDDLQGITVLVADGTEVGKLLLSVRNTTRQVLTVDLPDGARLTHCFRDGVPLRPAASADRPERVLVPLTRSEQTGGEGRTHVVEPGEMLSPPRTGCPRRRSARARRWWCRRRTRAATRRSCSSSGGPGRPRRSVGSGPGPSRCRRSTSRSRR
ncbi:MAG: hypothetical protein ABMB14_32855 [Myxococcota bacterium]